MKKVFYNNWIAKMLLAFSSCHTITIGPFVLSKRPEEKITQEVKNHECTHARQWIEMTVISGLIIWLLILSCELSPWWLILAALAFYIWYVIEFLIRLCILKKSNKAYKAVSFEKEADENEGNNNYLENCCYFAWIKYLTKNK